MIRSAIAVLALLATADLSAALRIIGPNPHQFADPGAAYTLPVLYYNDGPGESGATFTIELPPGARIASLPEGCTGGDRTAVCTVPALEPLTHDTLHIPITTPADFGGNLMNVRISSATEEVIQPIRLYWTFIVDNTNDDGPGSLRHAIASANASECGIVYRCKVTFRFAGPVPESGWYTIQPVSELPLLTANWTGIDGAIQTQLTGNTNPAGPEIEINGALAGPANGLVIANIGDLAIEGLTVNGFAANGIEFRGDGPDTYMTLTHRVVRNNYIGTDPTGTTAAGNGMRGISVFGWGAKIVDNVISGNAMSGIFWHGGWGAFIDDRDYGIRGNRIGVQAASDTPLPNGASGVYLGPQTKGVDMADNVIAFNKHFGVAMAGIVETALTRNRIWGNGISPIDIGLDGSSPVFGPDHDLVAVPLLQRATYDASTNTTTVEGQPVTRNPGFNYRIELYRGGEMREFVMRSESIPNGMPFRITVPGDLRGETLTATLTRQQYFGWVRAPRIDSNWQGFETQTSELSLPLRVE